MLRRLIIGQLAYYGHKSIIRNAFEKFNLYMKNEHLSADLKTTVFSIYLANCSEDSEPDETRYNNLLKVT